ncbi:MAG: S-layer homology domain-containing protein [Leptolyngbya sp. Prado105]|nr:S-layer homology domain-containing protein [Leptolyngbya sp. Prado105]
MIRRVHYLSLAGCLAVGITIATSTTLKAQQNSQGSFPDTQDHWARPFITTLAQRNILNGYPDGTYRPTRPVERDEFAAMIRAAFNQRRERELSSGSAYRDVPDGYWASAAIEEAYEAGFMNGYPDNTFRPRQPITRAEVLTSLARNLELSQRLPNTAKTAQSAQNAVPQNAAAQSAQNAAPAQQAPRRARRQIVFPIAALSLMQPLINTSSAVAQPTQAAQPRPPQATQPQQAPNNSTQVSASTTLGSYYDDADKIPPYARDAIASVTRAGVVVNHPNQRLLNPNQPATRGEMAAFLHQALVNKGQVPPLNDNDAASRYIVGRDPNRASR